MNLNEIRVSMAVEIEGKAYFVALPQESLRLLVSMAEGLSNSGKLPIKKAPEGFVFFEVPA